MQDAAVHGHHPHRTHDSPAQNGKWVMGSRVGLAFAIIAIAVLAMGSTRSGGEWATGMRTPMLVVLGVATLLFAFARYNLARNSRPEHRDGPPSFRHFSD